MTMNPDPAVGMVIVPRLGLGTSSDPSAVLNALGTIRMYDPSGGPYGLFVSGGGILISIFNPNQSFSSLVITGGQASSSPGMTLINDSDLVSVFGIGSSGHPDTHWVNNSFMFSPHDCVFTTTAADGLTNRYFTFKGSGVPNFPDLPTSAAGLVHGDVWRNGTSLNIV